MFVKLMDHQIEENFPIIVKFYLIRIFKYQSVIPSNK